MSKSLIQVANQTNQVLTANSIIGLGSVQRRYGCNLRLSGNGIECVGEGYYEIDGTVSLAPTAEGEVSVAVYKDGVQVPGIIAFATVAAAGDLVTLPLVGTIRQSCCDTVDNLTLVLQDGDATVTNVSLRVVKS